jgi:hypothetical protein
LTAKWNGNTYILDTDYDGAVDVDSMYILEDSSNDRVYNIR